MKSFSPEEDFPLINDKTEAIRISRPGSRIDLNIQRARRRKSRIAGTHDGTESRLCESRWIFPDEHCDGITPAPGDRIHDTDGVAWTILRVNRLHAIRCWECETQDVRLRHGLDTWLDFYAARWELDASGFPVITYVLYASGINAKIVTLKNVGDAKSFLTRYEIFFEHGITPGPEDCFITPERTRLRVLEFHPATAPGATSKCLAEALPEDERRPS